MRSGLADVIRAFRAEAPEAVLDLWEAGSQEQADAVRAGHADVGFVLLPTDERHLHVRTLGTAPVVVVVPEAHALAGRATATLADLADEPQVAWAREPTPEIHDAYLRACHEAGFVPRVVQQVRHAESLLGLVAAGVGVGTMHAARVQPGYPGVAYVALDAPALSITTGVVWRRGSTPPLLAHFLDAVAAHAAWDAPAPA